MKDDCKKYNKSNIGRLFEFTLVKEIKIPSDDKKYYIIQDAGGCKYTLPALPYKSYGFKLGMPINCYLDRINCNDELFFEPKHPYYEEGQMYSFEVIGKKTISNYLGLDETVIEVKDKFEVKHLIHYANNIQINKNNIIARVAKIKKGELFLLTGWAVDSLIQEAVSQFKIIGKKYIERFNEAWLIADAKDNVHAIPIEPYKHYKLDKKDSFNARVVKISTKGFLHIEPEHPVYQLNKSYSYKIVDKLVDNELEYAFVEDQFGELLKTDGVKHKLIIGDTILCRVVDIKKGKPKLKVIN